MPDHDQKAHLPVRQVRHRPPARDRAPTARERASIASSRAPTRADVRNLDWGHLRFFLELVRTGSHSSAAQRLRVDRNTVARRVAALEEDLGLALFERGPQGWRCTPAGDELAQLASRVEEDVLALARHADTRDRSPTGMVRLTTAIHISAHLLAPAVPALIARHPQLVLEVAADQRAFDLTRREADLAVRMGRPRDAGLVMRKLTNVAYGFYASRAWLGGRSRSVDFERDPFLGADDTVANTPHERWIREVAPNRRVVFRTNSTASLVGAARAGAGVALIPRFVGEGDPALLRLDGPEPAHHEMWLLVHGDLRRTPRVAAVIDWLDEVMAGAAPVLAGR
jgi:DNA-binding transcriptional LysR family regulator